MLCALQNLINNRILSFFVFDKLGQKSNIWNAFNLLSSWYVQTHAVINEIIFLANWGSFGAPFLPPSPYVTLFIIKISNFIANVTKMPSPSTFYVIFEWSLLQWLKTYWIIFKSFLPNCVEEWNYRLGGSLGILATSHLLNTSPSYSTGLCPTSSHHTSWHDTHAVFSFKASLLAAIEMLKMRLVEMKARSKVCIFFRGRGWT